MEHAHAHEIGHGHGQGGHAGHESQPQSLTRFAAVLVAAIAAVAVVVEMSGNDRQTAYLAHAVAASDLWSQYQGKSVRHAVMTQSALLLDAEAGTDPGTGPGADPGTGPAGKPADAARAERLRRAAADARTAAAALQDDPGREGMRQIAARATAEEHARDRALELHEKYERSVRGLQIAIVLIGLFMATRLRWLLVVGSALGAVALVYGALSGLGLA